MWKQKLQVEENQKRDCMGILKAEAQGGTFDKGHTTDGRNGTAFKNSEGKFSSQQPRPAIHISLSLQLLGTRQFPKGTWTHVQITTHRHTYVRIISK